MAKKRAGRSGRPRQPNPDHVAYRVIIQYSDNATLAEARVRAHCKCDIERLWQLVIVVTDARSTDASVIKKAKHGRFGNICSNLFNMIAWFPRVEPATGRHSR